MWGGGNVKISYPQEICYLKQVYTNSKSEYTVAMPQLQGMFHENLKLENQGALFRLNIQNFWNKKGSGF